MRKYALIINEETKEVQVGLGNDEDFYQSIGMTRRNVLQASDGRWYLSKNLPKDDEDKQSNKS